MVSILLVSCTKNGEIDVKNIEDGMTENPFDVPKSETELLGSIGHGLNFDLGENEYIKYTGKEVELEYYIELEGNVRNVGFLIFLSGEPQPYKLKGKEENYDYLHELNLEKDKDNITFQFEPVTGEKGDVLELQIVSIYNPNFIPDMIETSAYGVYHRALSTVVDRFKLEKPSTIQNTDLKEFESKYVVAASTLSENITEDFINSEINKGKQKFDMEYLNKNVLSVTKFNGEKIFSNINLNDNDTLKISYYLFGVPNAEYTTTFFVNHEPIYSIDNTLQKGKTEIINLDIGVDELDEFSSFYAISVPKYERKYKDELVTFIKTDSVLLYKGVSDTSKKNNNISMKNNVFSNIDKNIKNIYYGQKDNLLIRTDKLHLIDWRNKTLKSEVDLDSENIRAEKYSYIDNGYVSTICSNGKDGFIFKCIFYNNNLEYKTEIIINDIVNNERILGIGDIELSKSGKKILISTLENLYIYDIKSRKKTKLMDFNTDDVNNRLGITGITNMAFINNENEIAFTAKTFLQKGVESYATYGFMDINGKIIKNIKPQYNTKSSINMIPYNDFIIFEEEGEYKTGKLLIVDTNTYKEKMYNLKDKSKDMSVYGSDTGKFFATSVLDLKNNSLIIEVYETKTGNIIHHKEITCVDETYFKIIISDKDRRGIVLLGSGSIKDVKSNAVEFSF